MFLSFVVPGQVDGARQVLATLDAALPGIILVKLHRLSLERRHGFHDNVTSLFEEALSQSTSSEAFNFYSWRYAKYLSKVIIDFYPFPCQLFLPFFQVHQHSYFLLP